MFKVIKKSKFGRIGELSTNHGLIETPVFMPPATRGYVKAIDSSDLEAIDVQILLVNALHLYFKPGESFIKQMGGIHQFMGWPHPVLSDSGGFQILSFNKNKNQWAKSNEKGIEFTSPYDGSKSFITPEKAIEIQRDLKVDIIMVLDECSLNKGPKAKIKESMERTNQFAKRSFAHYQKLFKNDSNPPLIFGIAQGGPYEDLRIASLKFINQIPFHGIALGGESIGYDFEKTLMILDWLEPYIDQTRPLYSMGAGAYPENVVDLIKKGVDMFDCVSPARLARHGGLFNGEIIYRNNNLSFCSAFAKGILKISNQKFKNDKGPIDQNCQCLTCQNYSRAYLRYLLLQKDPLYYRLATIHNLKFMVNLIKEIKKFIYDD